MQGCGNDFICINNFVENKVLNSNEIIRLCSRHFGIGADGILVLSRSNKADFRMTIYNNDGHEAEMCGNGIRCLVKLAYRSGIIDKINDITIETFAGIKIANIIGNEVQINMGCGEILENPMKKYDLYCASVGNPHAIMVIDDLDKIDIASVGYEIENYSGFVNKTNVEFVQIIDRNNIKIRVWERGCGETLACGSGTSATVFRLYKAGVLDSNVSVELLGGRLAISIIDDCIYMTGDAVEVFSGTINE